MCLQAKESCAVIQSIEIARRGTLIQAVEYTICFFFSSHGDLLFLSYEVLVWKTRTKTGTKMGKNTGTKIRMKTGKKML